ncbi:alkaline phosphatase family protein [Polaribacter batillariae]|uniref:Alkaline phosphatase family protein n=1 Tax=Polaribacter batillariae TaxID=2808900 RepID=A0ABX7SSR5_9FLAO|nr:alkaline phosphatase family protein [Polaribacter batillariae]QTD37297.1 alkaline phosphatase family protein [Polaribacter batillariae]
MNKIFYIFLIAFSIQISNAQNNEKKVLFVIVDGISADVIEKIPTPNLDIIAKEGSYTRAYVGGLKDGYSKTPTISAVGYNSLLTGTWANKHNVWGNGIVAPNYKYWTIFRFAKELHIPDLKTAIFSTWLDNRTKLVGENLPATGNLQLDYHFDGFEKDTLNFPHDKERMFIHKIDEHVVKEASAYIKKKSPDLSWVYLEYTDDMGHRFGDSEQFYNAVKIMDKQIGSLWNALKYREKSHNENWEIFITTDHGRNRKTGKGHGGQSDRERLTWIVTNAKTNSYFKTKEPAIVDIMPTILRSLNLKPKKEQLWEIDGVPLTGKVSIANATANLKNNKLQVNWEVLNKKGKVKVYIATTNNFSKGKKDQYILMKNIKTRKKEVIIDVSKFKSSFYKVVLEGKYNTINTWVINK